MAERGKETSELFAGKGEERKEGDETMTFERILVFTVLYGYGRFFDAFVREHISARAFV